MFGKVIEVFGTGNVTYVCECPVCKTNYVIDPVCEDETNVRVTVDNYETRGILVDGNYLATSNTFNVNFHVTCDHCKTAFTSIVRVTNLAHGIEEKRD